MVEVKIFAGQESTYLAEEIADLIKDKCLFGFPYQRMEFEY